MTYPDSPEPFLRLRRRLFTNAEIQRYFGESYQPGDVMQSLGVSPGMPGGAAKDALFKAMIAELNPDEFLLDAQLAFVEAIEIDALADKYEIPQSRIMSVATRFIPDFGKFIDARDDTEMTRLRDLSLQLDGELDSSFDASRALGLMIESNTTIYHTADWFNCNPASVSERFLQLTQPARSRPLSKKNELFQARKQDVIETSTLIAQGVLTLDDAPKRTFLDLKTFNKFARRSLAPQQYETVAGAAKREDSLAGVELSARRCLLTDTDFHARANILRDRASGALVNQGVTRKTTLSEPEAMTLDAIMCAGAKTVYYDDKRVLGDRDVDFYMPELNLAIEVSPIAFHHSSRFVRISKCEPKCDDYHFTKWSRALESKVTLINLFEWDLSDVRWRQTQDYIASLVNCDIAQRRKQSLLDRGISFHRLDTSAARLYFEMFSVFDYESAADKFGVYAGTELIGCVTFSVKNGVVSCIQSVFEKIGDEHIVFPELFRFVKETYADEAHMFEYATDNALTDGWFIRKLETAGKIKRRVTGPERVFVERHKDYARKREVVKEQDFLSVKRKANRVRQDFLQKHPDRDVRELLDIDALEHYIETEMSHARSNKSGFDALYTPGRIIWSIVLK